MLRDIADETRLAYNWAGIETRRRLKRHSLLRYAPALAATALVVFVLILLAWHPQGELPSSFEPLTLAHTELMPVIAVPKMAASGRSVDLSDGSRLTIAPGAALEVIENSGGRFETTLHTGWVRFNVRPSENRRRTWIVNTKGIRFVVLGTQFTIHRDERRVRVAVHRGTVRVVPHLLARKTVELSAGESRTYVLPGRSSEEIEAQRGEISDATADSLSKVISLKKQANSVGRKSVSGSKHRRPKQNTASELAGMGASDEVNRLLETVDRARRQHRHAQAAALLDRILKEHPDDPAIGLVALTLGRIQLDKLGKPRASAAAFKRAAGQGGLPKPLREQALARCVESFYRAGDQRKAAFMSDRYKKRYPHGIWLSWVEYWGAGGPVPED